MFLMKFLLNCLFTNMGGGNLYVKLVRDVEGFNCLVFLVILPWRTRQLDLRTPALYRMGSFKCHCPMTKQCLINLGRERRESNPGPQGAKRERYQLCYAPPPPHCLVYARGS